MNTAPAIPAGGLEALTLADLLAAGDDRRDALLDLLEEEARRYRALCAKLDTHLGKTR